MKHIVIYIIIGITLLSCSERQEYVESLEQAQSLLDEHPDSALQILDSLSLHEQDFSKSFRMKYQLLKLQAQNKAFVDFTTDSIAKDLVKYYDRNGNANEKMMSHYLLGCTYRDLGEAPKAVDSYLEAISKADTTKSDCDFYTLSAVYAQMAGLFHKQLLLTNEINALENASHFCLIAKDTLFSITYKDKIAGIYILLNKKDSAEIFLKDVQRLYKQHNYVQEALRSSTKLMFLYVGNKDRITDAKHLMDEYEKNNDSLKNGKELPSSQKQYYYYKGLYYEVIGKLDSAEYYYRKQFAYGNNRKQAEPMYKGLLSVFSKRHQADSIVKYSRLYCEVNDSSIAKKDQDITAQMAAIYNYNRYQKQAYENEAKANNLRLLLVMICFICVVTAIILWNKYKKAKAKKQQELFDIKTEYINAINEYNNNLHTLQLIDASHQEEIVSIQKENEILKSKIEVLKHKEVIQEQVNKSKDLKDTDIAKRIAYLINHPTVCMTETEWEKLADTASIYFPELLHDLNKTPKISQQEMRTCILLCFSLRESDIALLLNTSSQRITNAKSTLNMKLFGDNSARTLYKNLTSKYNIYTI